MTKKLFGGDGIWFKAKDYEIVSGVIEPSGDVVTYDPWFQYNQWRNAVDGAVPPYLSLLNCLNELIYSPGNFADIYGELISRAPRALEKFENSEMPEIIINCCRESGLLGSLPRRLHAFRYDQGKKKGELYRWSSSGWTIDFDKREDDLRRVYDSDSSCEERMEVWVSGDMSGLWEDYFDESGVEAIGFPPPLSNQFWATYREPVIDYISDAVTLLTIVRAIFDPLPSDEEISEAIKDLNAFLGSSKPLLAKDSTGALFCRWVTPSILDAFALMIAMDTLIAPRRIVVCGNCGKLFIPSDKRSGFCDARCQNTGNKRLTRKRQKMARQLAAKGMSPEDISVKIQSPIDAIIRWIKAD